MALTRPVDATPGVESPLGNWGRLREPRQAIMLHYDASSNDRAGVQWVKYDSRVKVSYNFMVTDAGRLITITPFHARAWHAGVCRPSDPRLQYTDANSAFYGISITATVGDIATDAAKRTIAQLCFTLFHHHDWAIDETYRIVSHRDEAWPRGRKTDPEPVMHTSEIRQLMLDTYGHLPQRV